VTTLPPLNLESQLNEGQGQKIGIATGYIDFLQKCGPGILEFTLTHEVSHYLYENYISVISPKKLSPSGQGSIYEADPSASDHSQIIQIAIKNANAHAEVDAFAVSILNKKGWSKQDLEFVRTKRFNCIRQAAQRADITLEASMNLNTVADGSVAGVVDFLLREVSNRAYIERLK
jgi:hypothetical protein